MCYFIVVYLVHNTESKLVGKEHGKKKLDADSIYSKSSEITGFSPTGSLLTPSSPMIVNSP